ncbi:MAG: LapA family protein [Betaproteobacteria bacterium]|nr:MAG: LapA family protein [Betaproteobacteria bacterium]
MRVLAWTLRIVLFLALFLFALKNTDTVSLRLYFDQVWQAPLILVLLVFFAAGAAMGVLATLVTVFRQRRDIARLQRELRSRPRDADPGPPVADGDIDSLPEI